MKALLLHCRNYHISVGLLANRPSDVQPELVDEIEQSQINCITALVTVENGDSEEAIIALYADIKKMADDTGRKNIVILPFAHLSNNLADSDTGIKLLDSLKLLLEPDFNVKRSHFGSHKEFLVDVFGHPGNVRFREY